MARIHSLWITFIFFLVARNAIVAEYWSCDFSKDMCGFTDSAGENASWIRTNDSKISPGHDNTCKGIPIRILPVFDFNDLKRGPIIALDQSSADSGSVNLAEHDEMSFKNPSFSGLDPRFRMSPIKLPPIIDRNPILVPRFPRFTFNKDCYWLTTIPVTKFKGEQDFILYSKKQDKMDTDGCLRFSYHFFGLAKASFQVQVNKKQSTFEATSLFAKFVPQGNRWANAQVHVPKQDGEFYFIFKAHLDSKYQDIVGLDDISYSPSPCQPTANNDFESGSQAWVADSVKIATNGNPVPDHTTGTSSGHYAISTATNPSVLKAAITNLSQSFTSDEYNNCLKFYYNFVTNREDNDDQSYIEVNVTDFEVWDKRVRVESIVSDGLEKKWQLMSMNIPSYKRAKEKNYTVKISMYTYKNTKIAVDDIIVLDRMCQPVGDCDFESDFCGWSQTSFSNDGIWLRSDGANSGSLKESPKTDHTTLSEKGWFAMLPNEYLSDSSSYATLKSPPLGGPGATGSCFKFAYWAHTKKTNATVMRVSIHDDSKYGQLVYSKVVNGTLSAFWANFSMKFPEKMPKFYSIEIAANIPSGSMLSDVAIDDLKLTYGCDSDSQDPPVSTTPVPYSERRWDCVFDYSCSEWHYGPNWLRTSFSKLGHLSQNANPPRTDHSTNTHTGGYLLYMPQVDPNFDGNITLLSVINSTNITAKPHCFSFYYYDASEALIQLDINIFWYYGLFNQKTIRPNIASRTWTRVRLDIPYASQPWNLSLVLHAQKTSNASFAIDDIFLKPGACGHMEDYVYTMDQLDNMDINRISPLKNAIGSIQRANGYDALDFPDAPKHDHTTGDGGYFLFMNKKSDYKTTYKTELVIDNLEKPAVSNAAKGKCIKFAYQIVGNAKLEVYVDSATSDYHGYPFFRTNANHSKWVTAQATYSAYYKHKITFVMEKKFDLKSYIAIDDISFSEHCDNTIECDFDDDVCSYTSSYNNYNYKADYQFGRFVGPPLTRDWVGPGYDHTKQTYGGGYLYLTGYPSTFKTKRTAMIQTPVMSLSYEKSTNSCISMFTYITAPDAELVANIRLFAQDGTTTSHPIISLSKIAETGWTRHYADIDGSLFKDQKEFVFTIEGTTTEIKTLIAIDDISYSPFDCAFRQKFNCKNGKTISMDSVCNFADDCGDGTDEKECGSCNFEGSDTCSWNNGTDYLNSKLGGRWVPVAANMGTQFNGPLKDADDNKTGHYLLVQKSQFSDKNYDFIDDTILTRYYNNYQYQFKDAFFSCRMTFSTYMTTQVPERSRAYLEVWAGSDADSAVIKSHIVMDPTANYWVLNSAYIGGFPGPFIVQFRATEMAHNETIAIDNIQFQDCAFPQPVKQQDDCPSNTPIMCLSGQCISPDWICDMQRDCADGWEESYSMCSDFNEDHVPPTCAFEQSLDTCLMTTSSPDKFYYQWELTRGYVFRFTRYNTPSADHTTKDKNGQYMSLYTFKKEFLGKTAYLYSPMMVAKKGECVVRFFYYSNAAWNVTEAMHNDFRVYVQYADGSEGESDIQLHAKTHTAMWLRGIARWNSDKPFRFVFAGTLNDLSGSISVDDLTYTNTCHTSDAVFVPGTPRRHGGSAFLIIILIVLSIAVVGGAFFGWRKHQAGDLSFGIVQARVRSLIPGSSQKSSAAFDNPHFNK